jgi:hypothetical protein
MPLGHSAILGTGEVRRFKHAPIGPTQSDVQLVHLAHSQATECLVGPRIVLLGRFICESLGSSSFLVVIATRGTLIILTLWTCFHSEDLVRKCCDPI